MFAERVARRWSSRPGPDEAFVPNTHALTLEQLAADADRADVAPTMSAANTKIVKPGRGSSMCILSGVKRQCSQRPVKDP